MLQEHRAVAARRHARRFAAATGAAALAVGVAVASAQGDAAPPPPGVAALDPGNLLISRSVYVPADITAGSTLLPPGCSGAACTPASAGGAYPEVFNNDLVDGSFGVTSPIYLDQFEPDSGHLVNTIDVPDADLVTSFSSKSELALNLSTSGRYLTFMGYAAAVDALDVSNSNTPAAIDPTNPVTGADYRAVATLGADGRWHFTLTNAYSGNNGRAAILADSGPGDPVVFAAGNAGNGGSPQPAGIVAGAGAQAIAPSIAPEAFQSPGNPTPVGSFNITQLPANTSPDKIGKDDNFRGLTIFDNVVYLTKGSGGNGINTVYFIDTTGKACPGTGVGVPQAGASLPSGPIAYDPATLASTGLASNMCILRGFPTGLAKNADESNFPFGIWFANDHTLYVADEGNGTNTYSTDTRTYTAASAAAQPGAGLQKWVFDESIGAWKLAYTLQTGLDLGVPYTPAAGPDGPYPTGDNAADSPPLPWAPATDGLRNITGRVNADGTATIWAVTSTVSGSGDQGADPNMVVEITDPIGASAPAAGERFTAFDAATSGEVLRGVSFTPGS